MATFPRLGNGAIEVLGNDDSACDRPSSAGWHKLLRSFCCLEFWIFWGVESTIEEEGCLIAEGNLPSRRLIRRNKSISSSKDKCEDPLVGTVVNDVCVGVLVTAEVRLVRLSMLGSVYVSESISGKDTDGKDGLINETSLSPYIVSSSTSFISPVHSRLPPPEAPSAFKTMSRVSSLLLSSLSLQLLRWPHSNSVFSHWGVEDEEEGGRRPPPPPPRDSETTFVLPWWGNLMKGSKVGLDANFCSFLIPDNGLAVPIFSHNQKNLNYWFA